MSEPLTPGLPGGTPRIPLELPIFVLAISFVVTLALMPGLLRRLRRQGLVVRDMYKPGDADLVTHAGLLGLALSVAALVGTLVVEPWAYRSLPPSSDVTGPVVAAQLALFTMCGYGIVGAIDDRRPLSQLTKAVVPLTLAFPAVALAASRADSTALLALVPALQPYSFAILLAVVPVYVLVVTNLVNMHSGYNGLQSGLSILLMTTILARLFIEGRLESNLGLVVVLGSTMAFYPFNRFPAKALEGNVGSFLVGATIGVAIAANGLFLAGIVMLAPHILDFTLFAFAKAAGRPFVKFGRLRADGTIEAPYPFKLKFLLPYYARLTEPNTVRLLYVLTAIACMASFLVPL